MQVVVATMCLSLSQQSHACPSGDLVVPSPDLLVVQGLLLHAPTAAGLSDNNGGEILCLTSFQHCYHAFNCLPAHSSTQWLPVIKSLLGLSLEQWNRYTADKPYTGLTVPYVPLGFMRNGLCAECQSVLRCFLNSLQ